MTRHEQTATIRHMERVHGRVRMRAQVGLVGWGEVLLLACIVASTAGTLLGMALATLQRVQP